MPPPEKSGHHPRSRHRERYDFAALVQASPELGAHVRKVHGHDSIDFADPAAVKALNRAILRHFYGVPAWDVPPGYLCPPIPGRADYVHHLADLLADGGDIPRGPTVRVLDVGVGANAVYPLVGRAEYGWTFVGTDVDPVALEAARKNDPKLELRRQASADQVLRGVVQPGEAFAATLCNPPFHASLDEARAGTERKWRNLGKTGGARNFGGQGAELWTPGGEAAFVKRLVAESARLPDAARWFTSLVSKEANVPAILSALKAARAVESRTIDVAQGQKKSRIVAWTFLDARERDAFRTRFRA